MRKDFKTSRRCCSNAVHTVQVQELTEVLASCVVLGTLVSRDDRRMLQVVLCRVQ